LPEVPEKNKITITPSLRKSWLRIRNGWATSNDAFSGALSMLTKKDSEELYGMVKVALFKASNSEIVREHPELRVLVKSDDDRFCMHDIYEFLSWKLGKSEPLPKGVRLTQGLRGSISAGLHRI